MAVVFHEASFPTVIYARSGSSLNCSLFRGSHQSRDHLLNASATPAYGRPNTFSIYQYTFTPEACDSFPADQVGIGRATLSMILAKPKTGAIFLLFVSTVLDGRVADAMLAL